LERRVVTDQSALQVKSVVIIQLVHRQLIVVAVIFVLQVRYVVVELV
jgi:hypothetical protein